MREKVLLVSTHPELYPDLEIECRVIENDKIGEYLETIPEDKKMVAYKSGKVLARVGTPGEEVKTTLKTIVDGREYILSEEDNTVALRTYSEKTIVDGQEVETEYTEPDIVVTNISSTSNEQYVVKSKNFKRTYTYVDASDSQTFMPVCDPRVLTQIDENIMIITAWGSKAVCLKGGYIVTYNADENDYNTLEKGAFDSTYEVMEQGKKLTKKNS